MNPYDRRAVRALWYRVRPDRDVFAPGPWPGPPPMPPAGQGGKPPGEGPAGQRPPDIPSRPPEQLALDTVIRLAAGYDGLARRLRAPTLRRLAAQCRRNAEALREQLEAVLPDCARIAGGVARDSRARSRLLSRLR